MCAVVMLGLPSSFVKNLLSSSPQRFLHASLEGRLLVLLPGEIDDAIESCGAVRQHPHEINLVGGVERVVDEYENMGCLSVNACCLASDANLGVLVADWNLPQYLQVPCSFVDVLRVECDCHFLPLSYLMG